MADKQPKSQKKAINLNSPWLRNTMKSLGLSATGALSSVMPAASGTLKSGAKTAKEIKTTITETLRDTSQVKRTIENNPIYKTGKSFIDNAIDDLKTGDWYKDRSSDAMGGGDDSLGEMDTFFEDLDESIESAGESGVTIGPVHIENPSEEPSINAALTAVSKHAENILGATGAQMDTMVSLGTTSLVKIDEVGGKVVSELQSIGSTLASMLDYYNNNFTKFIEASIGYYEQTSPKKEESYSSSAKISPFTVFGDKGLDFEAYKNFIAQNFKKTVIESSVGSIVGMATDSADLLTANPMQLVMEMAMQEMIPKATTAAMQEMDQAIKNFVPFALEKIGKLGQGKTGTAGSVLRMVGDIFGIKFETDKNFDFKGLVEDTMPYNGVANHTIVQVIPKYLRESTNYLRILAEHFTKQESAEMDKSAQMLDWETGRFQQMGGKEKEIIGGYADILTGILDRSDFGKNMSEFANEHYTDPRKRAVFDSVLKQFFANAVAYKGDFDFANNENLVDELLENVEGSTAAKNAMRQAIQKLRDQEDSTMANLYMTRTSAVRQFNQHHKSMQDDRMKNGVYEVFSNLPKEDMEQLALEYIKKQAPEADIFGRASKSYVAAQKKFKIKKETDSSKILNFSNIVGKIKGESDGSETPAEDAPKTIRLRKMSDEEKKAAKAKFIEKNKARKAEREAQEREETGIDFGEGIKAFTRKKATAAEAELDDSTSATIDKLLASPFKHVTSVLNSMMTGNYDAAWEKIVESVAAPFAAAGAVVKEHFLEPIKVSLFGEKDKDGHIKGGLFEGVNNRLVDSYYGLRKAITGKGYTTADGETIPDAEGKDAENTVVGKLKHAVSWTKDALSEKLFGKSSKSDEEDEEGGIVGKTKMMTSSFSKSIKKGLIGWRDALFGTSTKEGEEYTDEEIEAESKKIVASIKAKVQDTLPDAIIGMGAGGILGTLVGGPVAGAMIGTATGILSRSEKFQKFVFGDDDSEGLISKKTQEYFKKNGKALFAGAVVGAGSGALKLGLLGNIAGGPVVGALLGTATAIVGKSKAFQSFWFGDEETGQVGLKTNITKWVKSLGMNQDGEASGSKLLGMSAIGALGGGALGALVGMPVAGAAVGLGASILAQAGNFKTWLFGEEKDGVKRQGILGQFGNMLKVELLNPLRDAASYIVHDAKDWLRFNVMAPAGLLLEAAGNSLVRGIQRVTGTLSVRMAEIGVYIKENFLQNVVDNVGKIIQPVREVVTNVGLMAYGAAKKVIEVPIAVAMSALSPIARGVRRVGEGLLSATGAILDTLLVKPAKLLVKGIGKVTSLAGKIVLAPLKLISGAVTLFKNTIGKGLARIGRFATAMLTDAVKFVTDKIVGGVLNVGKGLVRLARDAFFAPVKLVANFAKNMLVATGQHIKKTVTNAFGSALGKLFGAFKGVGKWIGERASDIREKVTGKAADSSIAQSGVGRWVRKNIGGTIKRYWDNSAEGAVIDRSNTMNEDGTSKLTIWERYKNTLKDGKNAAIRNKKEYEEAKLRNKNERLIRKYTKNQRAEDTEENRRIAEQAAGRPLRWQNVDPKPTKAEKETKEFQDESLEVQKSIKDNLEELTNFLLGEKRHAKKTDEEKAQEIQDIYDKAKGKQKRINQIQKNIDAINRQGNADDQDQAASLQDALNSTLKKQNVKDTSDVKYDASAENVSWEDSFNKEKARLSGAMSETLPAKIVNGIGTALKVRKLAKAAGIKAPTLGQTWKLGKAGVSGYIAYRKAKKAAEQAYISAANDVFDADVSSSDDLQSILGYIKPGMDGSIDSILDSLGLTGDKKDEPDVLWKGTSKAKKGYAVVGERGPEVVYDDESAKFVGVAGPEVIKMKGGETVIPNSRIAKYEEGTPDYRGPGLMQMLTNAGSDKEIQSATDTSKMSISSRILRALLEIKLAINKGFSSMIDNIGSAGVSEGIPKEATDAVFPDADDLTIHSDEHPGVSVQGTRMTIKDGDDADQAKVSHKDVNAVNALLGAEENAKKAKLEDDEDDARQEGILAQLRDIWVSSEAQNENWLKIFGTTGLITGGVVALLPVITNFLKNFNLQDVAQSIIDAIGNAGHAVGVTVGEIFDQAWFTYKNDALENGETVGDRAVALTQREGLGAFNEHGEADVATGSFVNAAANVGRNIMFRDTPILLDSKTDQMVKFASRGVEATVKGAKTVGGKIVESAKAVGNFVSSKTYKPKHLASKKESKLLKQAKELITKFFNKVTTMFKKKSGKEGAETVVKKFLPTVLETVSKKWDDIATKVAAILGVKGGAAAITAGLSVVVSLAAGAINGVTGTAKLFHVNEADVDGKMKLISGIFGAITDGTTAGSIMDIVLSLVQDVTGQDILHNLAVGLYDLLASDKESADLKSAIGEMRDDYTEYQNAEIKSQYDAQKSAGLIDKNMTLDEFTAKVHSGEIKADYDSFSNWNTKQNASLSDKIGQGVSKLWKGVTGLFSKKETYTDSRGNTYTSNRDGTVTITDSNGKDLGKVAEDVIKNRADVYDATIARENAYKESSDKLVDSTEEYIETSSNGANFKGVTGAKYVKADGRGYYMYTGGRWNEYSMVGDVIRRNVNPQTVYDLYCQSMVSAVTNIKSIKTTDIVDSRINNLIKLWANGAYYYNPTTTSGLYGGYGTMPGGRGSETISLGKSQPSTLNGMPYYSQNDTRWSNAKFIQSNGVDDGATMADTGCGPTAMSMIVSGITGKSTTPMDMASIAQKTGNRDYTGTNWEFVNDVADIYGLHSTQTIMPSSRDITETLRRGQPMILSGQDSGSGSPYTSAGHYIVATGIDENGYVSYNDPRGAEFSGKKHISDFISSTNSAWSFHHYLDGIGASDINPVTGRPGYQSGRNYGYINTPKIDTSKLPTGPSSDSLAGQVLRDREHAATVNTPTIPTGPSDDSLAGQIMRDQRHNMIVPSLFEKNLIDEAEEGTGYQYHPRLTAPEEGNKYYIRDDEGGYNPSILGRYNDKQGGSHDKISNVLPNCVGYAVGRFNEIVNEDAVKYLKPTNAENFALTENLKGLTMNHLPSLGSVMVWRKGELGNPDDGAGHVAIVEQINDDGSLVTSESGWKANSKFWTKTRNKNDGDTGNWGQNPAYKFMGFIHNPAVPSDAKLAEPVDAGSSWLNELGDGVSGALSNAGNWLSNLTSDLASFAGALFNAVLTGNYNVDWDSIYKGGMDLLTGAHNINTENLHEAHTEDVAKFLQKKGLNASEIAGILGVWTNESDITPGKVEGWYLKDYPKGMNYLTDREQVTNYTKNILWPKIKGGVKESAYYGDDGHLYPGVGLAQWTGPRGQAFANFMNTNNYKLGDIQPELNYFWKEITPGGARSATLEKLKATTSPEDAAETFSRVFEGYEVESGLKKRRTSARQWYETLTDGALNLGGYGERKSTGKVEGIGSTESPKPTASLNRKRYYNTPKHEPEQSKAMKFSRSPVKIPKISALGISSTGFTPGGKGSSYDDAALLQILGKMIEYLSSISTNTDSLKILRDIRDNIGSGGDTNYFAVNGGSNVAVATKPMQRRQTTSSGLSHNEFIAREIAGLV